MTRPSLFVVAVNLSGVEEVEEGLSKVRMTGIEDPGRPMVVSRTWHVIGGFLSVDIVGWLEGVGAVAERWFASASMRWVAGEGIDLWWWQREVDGCGRVVGVALVARVFLLMRVFKALGAMQLDVAMEAEFRPRAEECRLWSVIPWYKAYDRVRSKQKQEMFPSVDINKLRCIVVVLAPLHPTSACSEAPRADHRRTLCTGMHKDH